MYPQHKVFTTKVIRPLDDRNLMRSICIQSFGALAKAELVSRPTFRARKCLVLSNVHQTCSVYIVIDLQSFGCNLKGSRFDPPGLEVRRWGSGIG